MLRLSLILTIVAGLAAAGLNFSIVRQKMIDTMNELDETKTNLASREAELAKTKTTLKKTEEDLTATTTKLTKTEGDLKKTRKDLADKTEEANELTENLAKTTAAKDTAEQLVEVWRQLRVTPDQVKKMIVDLDKARDHIAGIEGENALLDKKLKIAQARIDTLVGVERKVEMPGVKGRVVAVDPKFDFVVIDAGEDRGALEGGEMLVNRNGKLVGKIRIAAVKSKESIANVLPEWKRDEIMEGDQVLY